MDNPLVKSTSPAFTNQRYFKTIALQAAHSLNNVFEGVVFQELGISAVTSWN